MSGLAELIGWRCIVTWISSAPDTADFLWYQADVLEVDMPMVKLQPAWRLSSSQRGQKPEVWCHLGSDIKRLQSTGMRTEIFHEEKAA